MANSINRVIAGDYSGSSIIFDGLSLNVSGFMSLKCKLDKSTVENYNVVKSSPKGIFYRGSYTISVDFTDGKRSLISLDDKYYEIFLKSTF